MGEVNLNALPYSAVVLNKKGIIEATNNKWKGSGLERALNIKDCGKGADYLEGIQKSFSENDEEAFAAYVGIKEVLRGDKQEFKLESPCHSSEENRWFKLIVSCCEQGALIIHEDITEHKKYYQQLKKNKERFQRIIESVDAVLWEYNIKEDKFKYVSTQTEKKYGYKPKEWTGVDFWIRNVHPEDREKILQNRSVNMTSNRLDKNEYRFVTKNGEIVWLQDFITFEAENEKPIMLRGVSVDITEKKFYEKELIKVSDKLNNEFDKAERLHNYLLPSRLPQIESFKIAAYYKPAYRLGGDFYDFIRIGDQIIFYISDVSGHDLSSSMVNVFIKSAINYFLKSQKFKGDISQGKIDVVELVRFIRNFYEDFNFPVDYFISISLGAIDTKEKNIRICNAGIHCPPILLKEREVMRLEKSGFLITSLKEANSDYEETIIDLQPGDTFFAYTDGLIEQEIETKNGDYFGEERLLNILQRNKDAPPDKIIETVNNRLKEEKGNIEIKDDLTYIAIKYH